MTLKFRNSPTDKPVSLVFALGEDPWVRVSYGLKDPIGDQGMFFPATMEMMHEDGKEEEVDRNETLLPRASLSAELKMQVTTSKFQASLDGKKLMDGKRVKGDYGQFGMFAFSRADVAQTVEVSIVGEIQPSWLQNKVDAAMEDVRAEFDASYEEEDHLPAWLLAPRVAAVPVADGPPQRIYPGPELEGDARDAYRIEIDHLKYLGEEEGLDAQLAHVDELASGGEISAALLSFMRMRVLEDAGRFEQAIAEAEKVLTEDSSHLATHVRRARLFSRIGKEGEADAAWAKLVAAFPGSIDAVEEYINYLIERNDIGGAATVARAAAFASVESAARLDWLRKVLLMADKGPSFERSFEHSSEHYIVRSDISRELCSETAKLLESAYTSYSVHLRRVSGIEKNKFRVYLFSGESSYKRYADEAFGGRMENTAGVYSRLVKQLLIWNLPDADERRHTVIHEGFHQYFDALTEETPRWLNEGIAQYYELADTVNGKFTTGQVDARQLRYLAETGIAPLAEFFQLTAAEFMDAETVTRNYAQAWAFAHYLRHSGKPRAAIYEALFNGLCDGMSADGAVRAAFADVDLDALESESLDYLDKLSGS
ncbi:MAG: DUF1570 domain-containing protein [Planctomycetota bacterium]|nr:DUF1570 domain-containing protein [Planctomycetota bacterium]